MLLMAFLQWWYGPGWANQVKAVSSRVRNISDMFSYTILLRTLFAPWKQIITHVRSDQAVGLRFRAVIDNAVSRLVGFMVRGTVLVVATLSIAVVGIFSLVVAVAWPVLPALVVLIVPAGLLV